MAVFNFQSVGTEKPSAALDVIYLRNEISKNETPAGFIIDVRIPQETTKEKCLLECDEEFTRFAENPLTQ